jgi:hypothetical protein
MPEVLLNGASSTLVSSITNVQTTITIAAVDLGKFPSSASQNYRIAVTDSINTELMLVTGGQGTQTLTVTRAVEPYGGFQTGYAFTAGSIVAQVLTSAGFGSVLSTAVKYAQVGPLLTAQPNVPFTLPVGYLNAVVRFQARSDTAAEFTLLGLQFNGDTGPNYDSQIGTFTGTTQVANEYVAATQNWIGYVSGANAGAGNTGTGHFFLPNYAGTVFRKQGYTATGLYGTDASGNHHWAYINSSNWRNTGAVTSMLLFPQAGNFIAGSIFALYLEP